MSSKLPLIVGFGGFNAAGRSSGHLAYQRMVYESLNTSERQQTLQSLASLMGMDPRDDEAILAGTLVRRIESQLFDVDKVKTAKRIQLPCTDTKPVSFTISRRNLPSEIPENWQVAPIDEEGRQFHVDIISDQEIKIDTSEVLPVKSAGQLPSGFNPGAYYRSQNHPRGLQMAILGASDAVNSMGIDWSVIANTVSPDEVSVYSSSIMSQLDETGFGGLLGGRNNGQRVTSKQLALGLNTMPADFINAYVLGSLGATAGIAGACATFLYNLRQGVEDIRTGRRKVVVVGASEAPILPEVIDGYNAMGALASDADLLKLDSVGEVDFRRASRPFGENCGFTIAESSQYVVLMADDLAVELGAQVFGAVPGVYVNADGFKKSISAPGPGNYITMAKAVALARNLLGDEAVRQRSFIQAHGSSTPQNRVTESKIFDLVAKNFGIEKWPVAAVKSYLGHTLAAASGDQLATSLGIFDRGILPGIKTHSRVADDVFSDRLDISTNDVELGSVDVAFLNSKGFGGNNATATVFSPSMVENYLAKRYSQKQLGDYYSKRAKTENTAQEYLSAADNGDLKAIYQFGQHLVDEEKISLSENAISIPGFDHAITLQDTEGFDAF